MQERPPPSEINEVKLHNLLFNDYIEQIVERIHFI